MNLWLPSPLSLLDRCPQTNELLLSVIFENGLTDGICHICGISMRLGASKAISDLPKWNTWTEHFLLIKQYILVIGKLGDDQGRQYVTIPVCYIFPQPFPWMCFDLVTLKLFMWKNFELPFIIILAKTMWFLSHRVKYWPLDDQPNHKGISWNHILGKPLPCLLPLSPSLLLLRENVSHSCGIPYV